MEGKYQSKASPGRAVPSPSVSPDNSFELNNQRRAVCIPMEFPAQAVPVLKIPQGPSIANPFSFETPPTAAGGNGARAGRKRCRWHRHRCDRLFHYGWGGFIHGA